jgi:nickel superoxide dismutase
MRTSIRILFVLMSLLILASLAQAHCQIPCGIYGDQTRFDLLREDIQTIEKSMNQINELSKDPGANINQLVRWVNNKDEHADKFSEIVTYYDLAQRIKTTEPENKKEFDEYQNKLTLLHQMMVYAMKCKQTTDLKNVEELKKLVDAFENIYFTPEDKEHLKSHHE